MPVTREFVGGILTGEGYFGLSLVQTPRLKNRGGFKISPRFALHMLDEETMDLVIEAFEAWELPYWIEPPRHSNGKRMSAQGMKRTTRIIQELLPYLTGKKKRAAELVLEFNNLRSSKPQNCPYGKEEVRLVNELRAINGGNFKHKNLLESSETIRRAPARVKI